MPQRWGEEAAAMLPHGALQVITGEFHCAHYSAPERTAEIIQKHIDAGQLGKAADVYG
jgi:hypothetical protein